jgi:hypothetical protein
MQGQCAYPSLCQADPVMFWSASVRERGDKHFLCKFWVLGERPTTPATLAVITQPLPYPRVAYANRLSGMEWHHLEPPAMIPHDA